MRLAHLNNSFSATSPTNSRLSSDSLSTRSSPFNVKDNWNLRDLEAKIKKDVRKQVSAASMSEELKVFFSMQKGVGIKKMMLFLGITLSVCYATSIEGAVIFTCLLLIATELLCSTILPFTDVNLINNIRKIQPIIYSSIYYSFMKCIAGINNQEINWPFTFVAIIATLTHCTLRFYKPFLHLAARNIIAEATRQKSIFLKLRIFPRYLMAKVRMTFKIARHLVLIVGTLYAIIILFLAVFNKISMELFQPYFLFYSLPLFILMECYFTILDFIGVAFSLDLRLSKIIKDKIPVFLNLLRLESNPFNRLIQFQCLKCVFMKVEDASDFLATETCKSLVYSTYMDIINQFASIYLQKADQQMQQLLAKIKLNDKTVKLKKGLLEDLLIYFKKFVALLQSEYQVSKYLEILTSLSLLFIIINKIQKSKIDDASVSSRVMSLTRNIYQCIKECSQKVSLSNYTCEEISSYYQGLISESEAL